VTAPPTTPDDLRRSARTAFDRGDFEAALRAQIELVNAHRSSGALSADDFRFLFHCFYARGDHRQAYAAIREAVEREPENLDSRLNLAAAATLTGRNDEALALTEAAARARPDDANILTLLAQNYQLAGRTEEARRAGLRSLALKDRAAPEVEFPLADVPVPPFDATRPERNVIAISLWGDAARYLVGAERNAQVAPVVYEGWTCRFYTDDSVPPAPRDRLLAAGADVVLMPRPSVAFAGLFWRFLVADDPDVDRYLIRDADAILNVQERVAVDDWIASGRHFHVMRDAWTHTEPMLAGLWGGVRGALPPMAASVAAFRTRSRDGRGWAERTIDQRFLREAVWPIVRKSVHAHDSIYRYGGAVDFPPLGRRPPGRRVGQAETMIARPPAAPQPGRILAPPAFEI
jgi:tetratricopeptide (TPR) repeat protein